jgi:type IV fimbrial biogenesis protein FimT
LGLAIVDEISRLHDANLTIDSGANGRGTRISVSFRGTGSENHVAIRRSAMPYGESPSAPRKLAPLESAPVNGNSALNRTTPEARTVSQSADHTQTAISFAARSSRGYSLVELIVVMTIVAIVIGIAVPSYKYVTNSNRVSAEVNLLLGDLQYARSEAVKEGSTVSVCQSNSTQTACLPNGANWNAGWIVFSDLNADGQLNAGDQLLRAQPGFSPSTDTFVSSDSGVNFLSFNREGFTTIPTTDSGGANGGLLFKLNVAAANVQWERCLLVSYVGVMQTLRGGTSPCT